MRLPGKTLQWPRLHPQHHQIRLLHVRRTLSLVHPLRVLYTGIGKEGLSLLIDLQDQGHQGKAVDPGVVLQLDLWYHLNLFVVLFVRDHFH